MVLRHRRPPPRGFAYVRVLAFLLGFAALIAFVSRYYLIPALEAFGQANPDQRRVLSAHSRLLLFILLFILLVGLILTFRVGRFFFPRQLARKPKPTIYPDAWAEAGRRMTPDDDPLL